MVVKIDEKKFWEAFLRNVNECLEALHMEQLVKRWAQTYVYGSKKKLNRSMRLNIKKEK